MNDASDDVFQAPGPDSRASFASPDPGVRDLADRIVRHGYSATATEVERLASELIVETANGKERDAELGALRDLAFALHADIELSPEQLEVKQRLIADRYAKQAAKTECAATSEDVWEEPPQPARAREACPPDRLLIAYEHAGCNTNTDVILPTAFPDLSSDRTADGAKALLEIIEAFEPTVIELAARNKPICPLCRAPMDFVVWGPHNDEVEGRWPVRSIEADVKKETR